MKIKGFLPPHGTDYNCTLGDSFERIREQNSHLTDSQVQVVFNITRLSKELEEESNYELE